LSQPKEFSREKHRSVWRAGLFSDNSPQHKKGIIEEMDSQVVLDAPLLDTGVSTVRPDRSQFVDSLTVEEREQIFGIYCEVWGERACEQIKRIFSWKFEKNPNLSPRELEVAVYRSQGRIVALLGAIPYVLKIGNRVERSSWLFDFISLPEFRSKGLWIAYKVAYSRPVIIGAPNSEVAYRTWKMMGKRYNGAEIDIGTYRHLVKFIAIDHLPPVRRLLVLKPLVLLANWMWKVLSSALWSRPWRRRDESVEIQPVERFGPEFDEFWERACRGYEIIPKRSSEYLNWRYLEHPDNNYRSFIAKREGQICGYLVLHAVSLKNGEGGRIVDILAERGDEVAFGRMAEFAVQFFKKRGAKEVRALESRCPALQDVYRRLGFKASFSRQKPLRLIGWTWIDDIPKDYFHNGDNWYFTYADCESDMMPVGLRE
jgi:hypothetical protein